MWYVTEIVVAGLLLAFIIYAVIEIRRKNASTSEEEDDYLRGLKYLDEEDLYRDSIKHYPLTPDECVKDKQERCVLCGRFTPYKVSTPIGNRSYYIQGSGQL